MKFNSLLRGGIAINIGIDIDGVINDLSLFHIACGTQFCYENNINTKINAQAMDSQEIFSWNQYIDNNFWEKYYLKLLLYPDFIRYCVSAVTYDLCNSGHKIYIISARKDADLPFIEKRSMYDITRMYLKNGNISYSELFLADNKWELICSLNLHLMIEDNPLFFMSPQPQKAIPLLCYDTPYNWNVCGKLITRVYSWHDILFKINNEIYKEDTYEYK